METRMKGSEKREREGGEKMKGREEEKEKV